MTGTEANTEHYRNYIPELFIYDGFRADVLENLIDYQQKRRRQGRQKPVFVLLEDCMWDAKKLISEPVVRRIFMNGRHYGIFFILTLQYALDLPPGLRAQTDYVFACRETCEQNRLKIYDNFGAAVPSFRAFDQVFQTCTENREVCVICLSSLSANLEDNIWYYKAQANLKFRMGEQGEWWKYHTKNFDPLFFEKPAPGLAVPCGKRRKQGTELPVPIRVQSIKDNGQSEDGGHSFEKCERSNQSFGF